MYKPFGKRCHAISVCNITDKNNAILSFLLNFLATGCPTDQQV